MLKDVKSTREVLRKLNYILTKRQRWQAVLVLCMTMLAAVLARLDGVDTILDSFDEELDALGDSVADLEDAVFDDEDEQDADFGDGDGEEEDFFEIPCPTCGEDLLVDDEALAAGVVDCPACGGKFALSFEDEEERPGDGE